MPANQSYPLNNYHPWHRKAAVVIMFALLCAFFYLTFLYFRQQQQEKVKFEERRKHAEHYLIDKEGNYEIYLQIYNGDTVGVFSIKQ